MIDQSPTDVVKEVFALLKQQCWSDVVAFLDPISVRLAWEERLASARRPREIREPMTVDDYRQGNPSLPIEVAQYYADRANNASTERLFNDVAGVETLEQLEQLTPEELAARMLEAGDSRYQLNAIVPNGGVTDAAEEAAFERKQVIGEIVDADTAYVLYRSWYARGALAQSKVAELRRTNDGWKLLPNDGLLYGPQLLGYTEILPPEQSPRLPLVKQIEWVKRRFDHQLTPEHFPAVLERFRGASARLAEMTTTIPRSVRMTRPDGKWSVHEHTGHLLDLEELGEQRLRDYLARAPQLSAADMSNRKTHESDHNQAELGDLLEHFNEAREALCRKLERLPADIIAHKAEHPRLRRPMNVPEWVFFMCEHDDHHLLRIRELSLTPYPNPIPSPNP